MEAAGMDSLLPPYLPPKVCPSLVGDREARRLIPLLLLLSLQLLSVKLFCEEKRLAITMFASSQNYPPLFFDRCLKRSIGA